MTLWCRIKPSWLSTTGKHVPQAQPATPAFAFGNPFGVRFKQGKKLFLGGMVSPFRHGDRFDHLAFGVDYEFSRASQVAVHSTECTLTQLLDNLLPNVLGTPPTNQ